MCERCAELEEELAYLKGERDIEISASRIDLVRRRFGLEPAGARLTLALYDAAGRVLSREALEEVTSPSPDQIGSNTLKVHVCRARKALGPDVVELAPGVGYRMTPIGRARVYQTLRGADFEIPSKRTVERTEVAKARAAGAIRRFSWEPAE